jgi:hypothetical protein
VWRISNVKTASGETEDLKYQKTFPIIYLKQVLLPCTREILYQSLKIKTVYKLMYIWNNLTSDKQKCNTKLCFNGQHKFDQSAMHDLWSAEIWGSHSSDKYCEGTIMWEVTSCMMTTHYTEVLANQNNRMIQFILTSTKIQLTESIFASFPQSCNNWPSTLRAPHLFYVLSYQVFSSPSRVT